MTTMLTTTTSTILTPTGFDPITSWDAIRAPATAQVRAIVDVDADE